MGEQALVVTTAHRGVFFGYGETGGESKTIKLKRARMCVSWPDSNHGVLGLASDGPKNGARISPAAPEIILHDVTAIMTVSALAQEEWEKEKWA